MTHAFQTFREQQEASPTHAMHAIPIKLFFSHIISNIYSMLICGCAIDSSNHPITTNKSNRSICNTYVLRSHVKMIHTFQCAQQIVWTNSRIVEYTTQRMADGVREYGCMQCIACIRRLFRFIIFISIFVYGSNGILFLPPSVSRVQRWRVLHRNRNKMCKQTCKARTATANAVTVQLNTFDAQTNTKKEWKRRTRC